MSASPVGLERVLAHAARRLERNGLQPRGRVTLERVTDAEVRALSGLLGARWRPVQPGARTSVDLAMVDAALRAGPMPRTLADAAAAMRGAKLVDLRGRRAAEAAARDAGWSALASEPALARHPALAGWLDRERAAGTAARTSAPAAPFDVLAQALSLIAMLPADPPLTLARFAAARCAGDPHALDRGRPLDVLVRRALAWLDAGGGQAATASRDDAEARREQYERWGLSCDELSSTVLCLGLRPVGTGALERALVAAASCGQPRVVTLRELRGVAALVCGAEVFCCENPDVVAAAADELGSACPPLVCTAGWPSTACMRLLRALVAGGATLRHHGDMDAEGLAILDRVLAVTGGEPWRMTPSDFAALVAHGAPLPSQPSPTLAHPALRTLADVMAATRRAVREEQALNVLLADLCAEALRRN